MLRSRDAYESAVQAAEFARYWRDDVVGQDSATRTLRYAHLFGKWVTRTVERAIMVRACREEEATVKREEQTSEVGW